MSDLTKNDVVPRPRRRVRRHGGDRQRGVGSPLPGWRPKELHPFQEVHGAVHAANATPGDLLFHIRADRRDLCFEFERQLLDRFGDSVAVADETVGFRYFDARDLLGFVDGTANPDGGDLANSTIVGDEDPDAVGGSYVVVQKYLHDMAAWNGLTAEQQEAIMGRTKPDNIELDDAAADAQKSHKTLATIEDADGEHDILRDNMPFGSQFEGVRYLLHRLQPAALGDRADAAADVRGSTCRHPRPTARLLDGHHGQHVLRAGPAPVGRARHLIPQGHQGVRGHRLMCRWSAPILEPWMPTPSSSGLCRTRRGGASSTSSVNGTSRPCSNCARGSR